MSTTLRPAARLGAAVLSAALILTAAPATSLSSESEAPRAAGYHWDTIYKLKGTKVQACTSLSGGSLYNTQLRVNNKRGKYVVAYSKHVTIKSQRVEGQVMKNIRRGSIKRADGMQILLPAKLKVSLWLGRQKKATKKVDVSTIGTCAR